MPASCFIPGAFPFFIDLIPLDCLRPGGSKYWLSRFQIWGERALLRVSI
jgi:hypothetical protein